MLNDCLLPNLPHFSLLSTFKLLYLFYEHVLKTCCFMELGYLWLCTLLYEPLHSTNRELHEHEYSKNLYQLWTNYIDLKGFLQKFDPHEPLTLPFEPFRFWLWFRGDIHIRKRTPRYHRYEESPTLHISCQLPALLIRGVANSPHHWYAESATPRITDTVSRRLRISLSQGVDDSADQWYGESLFKEKINLASIFRGFNG